MQCFCGLCEIEFLPACKKRALWGFNFHDHCIAGIRAQGRQLTPGQRRAERSRFMTQPAAYREEPFLCRNSFVFFNIPDDVDERI